MAQSLADKAGMEHFPLGISLFFGVAGFMIADELDEIRELNQAKKINYILGENV